MPGLSGAAPKAQSCSGSSRDGEEAYGMIERSYPADKMTQ
jgi:hypothetical protein